MRLFEQKSKKPKKAQQPESATTTKPGSALSRESRDVQSILRIHWASGNQTVQRLSNAGKEHHQSGQADAKLSSHVNAAIGSSGRPLGPEIRPYMDRRFGYDFGKVQVYSNSQAAYSAAALNAHAYTLGSNIVFGAGEYAPQTPSGRSLIAHELAHVIQQEGAPAVVQGKLRIGSPSDRAEQAADAAAHSVMAGDIAPYRSSALVTRDSLRSLSLPHSTIQRAVSSWGGVYDTDKYQLTKEPGMDGVDIELRFKPNKYVNSEKIGMVQTARSLEKGASVIIGDRKAKATLKSRTIPTLGAGAGTRVDRVSSRRIPLYGTNDPATGSSLAGGAATSMTKNGCRYKDKAGKLQEDDALLKDTPMLFSRRKETSQTFETTALAVKGVQEGTYYGSVRWGWEKNAAGKVKKLPLTIVSNDVPSSVFESATELWNKGKTSKGKDTINLPMVYGRYTNAQAVWLVSNPSKYKATVVGKIPKNSRLEVTDKGGSEAFNKKGKNKWWKVTVVDKAIIGKVGWVMQTLLSDKKTK